MDNMKKLLRIILILILVIILLIVAILIFAKNNSNEINNSVDESTDVETKKYLSSLSQEALEQRDVSNEDKILIQNCLQKYYNSLNLNSTLYYGMLYGEYQQLYSNEEIQEQVYQYLSEKYIKENNIQKNNVFSFVSSLRVSPMVIPYEIKKIDNENLNTFIVGVVIENQKNYELIKQEYLVINFDTKNKLFSVEPKGNEYNNIDDVRLENLEENIIQQQLNTYRSVSATFEEITKYYFNMYKQLSFGAPEIAYKLLDEEYRNKRFENVDNFKKYVQNNHDNIKSLQANQFSTNTYDTYTEYIIKDKYNNIYIFDDYKKEYSIRVKLDSYTILTNDYKEVYQSATNQKKVQMNIDKFIRMINCQDYRTAYNCLSNNFRNNYFSTEDEFKKEIKNRFFTYNEIQFNQFKKLSLDTFTYEIQLSDLTGESKETKNITIIMKLNDGFNFEMSFNM